MYWTASRILQPGVLLIIVAAVVLLTLHASHLESSYTRVYAGAPALNRAAVRGKGVPLDVRLHQGGGSGTTSSCSPCLLQPATATNCSQQQQPTACPPCPQTTVGDARGVAAAAKAVFGWESAIIDLETAPRHARAFEVLPEYAFPRAPRDMVSFWQQLQPYTGQFVYAGNNGMFGECDGAVLHAFVRHIKPQTVVEVGSGYSTHVVSTALRANQVETGHKARHVCVEPYRAAVLKGVDVEVVEKPVQEVDLSMFDMLEAGDLLFLDNSHVIRPYGDVIYEFLWILPRLKPGVFVHIHDILLPFDYIPRWIHEEIRQYTEQYMLAAFLYGNKDWKVVFHNGHFNNTAGYLVGALRGGDLESYLKVCSFNHVVQRTEAMPGSIYLQRVR